MVVLNFIVDVLGDANFLIAIIVAIGLIVQKKSFLKFFPALLRLQSA